VLQQHGSFARTSCACNGYQPVLPSYFWV